MARKRVSGRRKIGKKALEFRRKQKPGAIMSPETFKRIERKAAASGYKDPSAVAGSAYWNALFAKMRAKKKKKK
jgi:hypothetical protein